ncbi:RING-H2 finger protein ATL2 [Cynara cardunculus var. scolymus]|uniref:RING-type E3 ubiquitin transferase n=1 Tax=Cynara cardunculus var. scolymus TaxID=59895 RepID=A0A124SBU2_CYNCS|nr:RING-H2 finger protein ATL2 [Cynara cardunculus var. scolymus]KVH91705.1 Zinc finger, RING/FYVE/PHD-type [Cynara cardunculus var. scolymus]
MAADGTTVDPPNNSQWREMEGEPNSNSYALSGKIMLASIIVLFVVVVFLVLLHLYARWYLLRLQRRNNNRRRNRHNRSTRIIFYLDQDRGPAVPTGGLDSSVLKSLPLFMYSSETDGNMPECAVCLSEFEEGEKGRILPKCKHSFHTECIDMWFHSNSTCPLCRSPVEPVESEMAILIDQPESMPEPGSSNSLSSPVQPEHAGTMSLADRRKGIDVRIDVPTRNEMAADNDFRLPSPSQGFRSPASRLLALKRILSMSRKSPAASPSSGVGPSRLPVATESDLESATQELAHESTRLEADNLR